MRQNVFWLLGLLVCCYNHYVECSVDDNEIPELVDEPRLEKLRAGFDVNFVVDALLAVTRRAIEAEGASQISLDPVDTDINIPLGIATLTAHVKLVNGTFRALDSIKRQGDATVIPRIIHPELDVIATLGLQVAKARYHYYLEALGIHPNGNLTAVIGDNAVKVKFALNFDSKGCHLKLTELKMTEFSKVDVTLTGLYPFDTWSSKLATKLIAPLHGQIAELVDETLRYYIEQEIHKVHCS